MSLLHTVNANDATGKVKEIYDEITQAFGGIPEGIELLGLNPQMLQHTWENIKESMKLDMQTQKMQTLLRYMIADSSACEYCTGFNEGMLINMHGLSKDELEEIKTDPSKAPLDQKNKMMFLTALKAVKNSNKIDAEDIENLRNEGLSESEIFDLVLMGAQMMVIDMLFNSFKVH